MSVTIKLLRAAAAGNVPTQLSPGQIALDEFVGKLFWRTNAGAVKAMPLLAPPNTLLGNNTGQIAPPICLTPAEVVTMLGITGLASPLFTGLTTLGDMVKTGVLYDRAYQVVAPAAAAIVSIASSTSVLILNPGATLGSLTVAFPLLPGDGQRIEVATTQPITLLGLTSVGASIRNAPTSLAAGASFAYLYVGASATWFRTR